MHSHINKIKDRLVEKGLKVTPQRMAILEAVYKLNNHPTADMIMDFVKATHPGISTATVYKVLDALEENRLIARVKTAKDVKRYDGVMEIHHHLYSSESEDIKDYKNANLDQLLNDFFRKNQIDDFDIEEIQVQINGRFRPVENKE